MSGGRFLRDGTWGYEDDTTLAERAEVLAFTGPVRVESLEVVGVPTGAARPGH